MLKKIAFWTLPLGIQEILKSIKNNTISYNNKISLQEDKELKKNRELENKHIGKRCFILATGSSINEQNLKLLKNEFCIAVSNFYLHPDFKLINPHYYCVAPWHLPHDINNYIKLLKEIGDNSQKCSFFLGIREYKTVSQNKILLNHNVHYHDTRAKKLDKHIDLCKPVLAPQSVTVMALQSAIFMGFSEIYLLGCDHDSIVNYSQSFANQHFYPEEKSKLITDICTFKEVLLSYISLWDQYEMLDGIARKKDTKIFNATKFSLLDIFDKVDYQSLF
jgi:hypothetical protein